MIEVDTCYCYNEIVSALSCNFTDEPRVEKDEIERIRGRRGKEEKIGGPLEVFDASRLTREVFHTALTCCLERREVQSKCETRRRKKGVVLFGRFEIETRSRPSPKSCLFVTWQRSELQ